MVAIKPTELPLSRGSGLFSDDSLAARSNLPSVESLLASRIKTLIFLLTNNRVFFFLYMFFMFSRLFFSVLVTVITAQHQGLM